MFKTACVLIIMFCLAGCGSLDVKKSDGFNDVMGRTKKAGILVSRFSLVDNNYKKIEGSVANVIEDKIGATMGKALKENASILPFETVLLPNDDEIKARLASNLNDLNKPSIWKSDGPERAVGVNGMFGNLDTYFKKSDIDMLLVYSGYYTITVAKQQNVAASFIGGLAAGVLAGADFTGLGALAGGRRHVGPGMFSFLMGVDRNGTVLFTALEVPRDHFSADMLNLYGIEKAAKEVMEKVRKEL